ncbi:uncharacterized protein E5676_scaffold1327G00250 [Cucumis melo var. makuwa]|uniref:Uncharacterized protein n=1 Tax=Cucumis melo var. makuwa TaxID=1194695 RepID=A0A5D3D2R5_CUCMM|nr:uncharacterized protein E6C27_scaffold219G001100 [Cucumis melo var. makuwa]TYK17076.1 uncharacterized protein E5676_scaffold1327G00250 [Cucumis melo var. makuwa]
MSMHEESVVASSKETTKPPLKPLTVTDTQSPSSRFANFSHQRRPRIIISDSKSIEIVAAESESSEDDNVVLSNVLKRKASSKAPICKESVSDLSKKPGVGRSSNANELYEELFGISSLGHKASSASKVQNTYAPLSSKPTRSND